MRILLFLLLFSITEHASAKDKPQISSEPLWLYKIKPDFSKQPELRKISNGYYLELFDKQINLNNQTTYTHYIRKIINESGIQNASEISVQFAPEYETLTFHYIRVIRNGVVLNLLRLNDIKVIQEENDVDDYQYNGLKRGFIILKDIRKDDRIEAAYSLTGFNPVFNNKFTGGISFVTENPILNYYQTIVVDTTKQLRFHYRLDCPKPQELTTGDSRVYHWNNPLVSLWESESGTPAWFDPYPSVTISEFSNWQEVVNWGLSIYNNYHFELPARLKIKIREWSKQSNGDKDEFIRLALRFVQDDIRYLGLEIGANTHKPHAPSEVFHNGYGDCKDKALLLAAILMSENIPAYAALVNTGLRGDLVNYPSTPNEFDHVIVALEKSGGFKYVDPTLSYQRGKLSDIYTPAYQYALLLKQGETDLRRINHSENNIVKTFERLDVSFDDTTTLTVNTTYQGAKANTVRSYFATTSTRDLSDSYVKYYSPTFDGILMSKDIGSDDDSVNNIMKVEEAYRIPNVWIDDDSTKQYFLTYAQPVAEILTDPAGKSNKFPIALTFPIESNYTLDIQMPELWSLNTEKLHIKNDSYEFTFESFLKGSQISLKYSLITFKDHIPAAEVAQYKKDYKKISEVLQFRFTYYGKDGKNVEPAGGISILSILISLMAAAGAIAAFYFLNRKTIEVPYDRDSGYKLGSWIILLGFSLLTRAVNQMYNLYNGNYFTAGSYAIWETYGQGFVFTAMIELTFSVLWVLSTLAIIYWYFKKRDIFPLMFNGYITLMLATQGIMYLLCKQYADHSSLKGTADHIMKELIMLLIYGAVWCTYLARSHRVKGTFLREYKKG